MKKSLQALLIINCTLLLTSCESILKIEEWRAKTNFYSILILTVIGGVGFLISEFKKKKNDDK